MTQVAKLEQQDSTIKIRHGQNIKDKFYTTTMLCRNKYRDIKGEDAHH